MDRVSSAGFQTIGGRRTFQNKNLGAAIIGTTFDEVWFAGVQESIIGALEKVGITPADSALGSPDIQLWQAIALASGANIQVITSTPGAPLSATSAGLVFVDATGGNISIALPAVASANGVPIRFNFVRKDTSSNTVSISFHSGDTLLWGGSGPISLPGLASVELFGDGTSHWVLFSSPRTKLTGPLDLYVAASGGSDSNSGLTSGAPFATPAHAIAVAQNNYDTQGYRITINFLDGSYSSQMSVIGGLVGAGPLTFKGNLGNPSNVVLNVVNGCCFNIGTGANLEIAGGFTLQASGTAAGQGAAIYEGSPGTSISYATQGGIIFGACAVAHVLPQVGSEIVIGGNYTISGSAPCHFAAINGGTISNFGSATITLAGTPAFSNAFAIAVGSGSNLAISSGNVGFSGAAAGQKYNASVNGAINTNGGGASFFPGSIAGATSNGGTYV